VNSGNQFTIIKKKNILLHRQCTHHKREKKAMNETKIKQGKESMKKYVNLSWGRFRKACNAVAKQNE